MEDKQEKEAEWLEGFHTSSNGRSTPIANMDTRHLTNTINKFKALDYDVSALEAELAKRSQE